MLLIALLVVLLLASFLLSGTETAFFALNRVHLRRLERDGRPRARRVLRAAGRSQELLNTVLVGNNLANIGLSVLLTTLLLDRIEGGYGLELAILTTTLLILLIGDVTPKTLAITYPETMTRLLVDPYRALRLLLLPATAAVSVLAGLVLRAIRLQPIPVGHSVFFSRADLGTLLEGADEEGVMTARESELVQRILDFSSTRVEEVMTPRVDMVAAPVDLDRPELEALAISARHSRIPVYRRTIDDVVGYLKVRDFLLDPDRRRELLIRPVAIFPERARASKVFYEMQRRRTAMAVVVNEYGETVGLLTREDLIEEVVGDIYDEYEVATRPLRRVGPDVWIAEGRLRLDELNEELDLRIPSEDALTLSGFLTGEHGGIPPKGERIAWNGVEFTVLEVSRHRIQRCQIRLEDAHETGERG